MEVFTVAWVLAFCTVLFASFVRGVSGFGAALIMAPVLLLITGSKSIVVVNLILGVIANIIVLCFTFRHVNLRGIIPMSLCSLLGIPLGVWVITVITPETLKVFIGAATIVFAIPLALGITREFKREAAACSISGFLSGFLSSSTSMAGPPVVLFMHNQNWQKEVIYANLTAYFLFSSVCSLAALSTRGFVEGQVAVFALSLVPAMLIGTFIGIRTFRRLDARFFRGLALVIVFCAGLLGIVSGVGWLG